MLLLSACSTLEPAVEAPQPEPAPVVETTPEPEIPIVPVKPPEIEPLPEPPTVAIALTSRQPAYEAVAHELAALLDDFAIYDLSDRSQPPVAALRLINDSDAGVVVAIGLRAARSSAAMSAVPVVFCQVFNHQDYKLAGESIRGVAALAPAEAYLRAWRDFDPAVRRVGAIIGPGHDELIEEALAAAERHGIELLVKVVGSDQEALYQFRRMVRDIDGFWLFPDNRVLSPRSLKELLAQAKQHGVPVAVSQESMLPLGAAMSVASDPHDIARNIVNVIRRIEAGQIDALPPVSPLSDARIVIATSATATRSASRTTPAGESRE